MTRERFNKRVELINNIGMGFSAKAGPQATILVSHTDGWSNDFHPSLDDDDVTFVITVLRDWNYANNPGCTCGDEYDWSDDHAPACAHNVEGAPEIFLKVPERFLFAQYNKER